MSDRVSIAPDAGATLPTSAPPAGSDRAPWRALLVAAAVALVTIGLYAGVLDHQFVNRGDPTCVTENPLTLGHHYRALLRAVVSRDYQPLSLWSLAWNVRTPLSPRPFLVTNLVLHALNTVLAFALVWMISRRRLAVATLVALLFGIHPMHVESVAWIAARKDVLYAAFYLGGLIAYWCWLERRARAWLGLAFALFVLSCLANGMAVTFPLAMLLLDLWHGRPLKAPGVLAGKLPFVAVAIVFGAIMLDVQLGGDLHGLLVAPPRVAPSANEPASFGFWSWVATPAFAIVLYLRRVFLPFGLATLYPDPFVHGIVGAGGIAAPIVVLALIGLALWDLGRTRLLAFGIGWFLALVALAPQWAPGPAGTDAIPVGWTFTADRYTYLAYVGLFFVLAMGIDAVWRGQRSLGLALWAAAALFALVLLGESRRQIATWSTSESLWSRALTVRPGLALAHVYRGRDRLARRRAREADADFRAAFTLGLHSADVYEGLGNVSASRFAFDSARVQLGQAIRLDPTRGRAYYNRGIVEMRAGLTREAVADLDTALARLPREAAAIRGVRGYAKVQLGDCPGAIADFDQAVAGGVRDPGVRYGRGWCRQMLGDRDGAVADYQATLRINPGYIKARQRLQELGR